MTNGEQHESELVLGNKQLLSVLFIIFCLLGVFFAMGYLMGRSAGTPMDTAQKSEPAAAPVTGRRSQVEGERQVEAPVQQQQTPAETAASTPAPAETSPAQAAAPATKAPDPSPSTSVVEPQIGQTFLQVSAVAKPEAEILTEVLQKKGFHAIIAPGPNNLFRVLVGPSKDPNDLAKTKGDLEQAGFKPMVRRY